MYKGNLNLRTLSKRTLTGCAFELLDLFLDMEVGIGGRFDPLDLGGMGLKGVGSGFEPATP